MVWKAGLKDLAAVTQLACSLWPSHSEDEMQAEIAELLGKKDAAFFLAYVQDRPVGFSQCQLRHDYVEGTSASPVGYLEGIYVAKDWRKHGIARELLSAAEDWAKEQGCREFASDCELTNMQSLKFHVSVGFEEANRIICFTKKI